MADPTVPLSDGGFAAVIGSHLLEALSSAAEEHLEFPSVGRRL